MENQTPPDPQPDLKRPRLSEEIPKAPIVPAIQEDNQFRRIIEKFEAQLATLESILDSLCDDVTSRVGDMQYHLEERLDGIETRMAEMGDRLDSIEDVTRDIEKEIDNQHEKVVDRLDEIDNAIRSLAGAK